MSDDAPKGMWARALDMADRTPESRNRYADLLRAIAISCVVMGHWTMAAPFLKDGAPAIEHLLAIEPWSRWLTWCFQVMPVFFFVGGFSNGMSWEATLRKGGTFGKWFGSRLERLLGPTLALLLFWAAAAAIGHALGVPPEMIKSGSQIALVPTWFLAVYTLVCMTVPWTHKAWERFGMASVVALMACAVVMDVIFFQVPSLRWMAWSNFLFIWLAVHQLGYAWQDGLKTGGLTLGVGIAGLVALVALVHYGPYPVSLVGVPGQMLPDGVTPLSNTRPPKLPILAHGLAQIGLLLALQGAANRWLSGRKPWAATVLANSMIMTLFLWHSTSMMLLFGLGFLLGGVGLEPVPGTGAWWSIRPLWILAFAVGTVPFVAVFRRFERTSGRPPVGVARQVFGCVAACVGLALLAISGVNDDAPLGLRWLPLSMPLIGCAIAGFGPLALIEAKLRGASSREAS